MDEIWCMKKLKEAMTTMGNQSFSEEQIAARLPDWKDLNTNPTHPPYAGMVEEAIKELKKDNYFPTDEEISNFIETNYVGQLPWAHTTIFKNYMKKYRKQKAIYDNENGTDVTDGEKKNSLQSESEDASDEDTSQQFDVDTFSSQLNNVYQNQEYLKNQKQQSLRRLKPPNKQLEYDVDEDPSYLIYDENPYRFE